MPGTVSTRVGALSLACALACGVSFAQSAPPSSAAASAAERAQKEADRTMYWIRVVATRPAPAPAPAKPATKPAPAAAPATAKPVIEARDKALAVPVPTQAATTATGGKPALAGVVHEPAPGEAPVVDLPEPSALSSRGADNIAADVATAPAPEVVSTATQEPDRGLVQLKLVQPQFPPTVVERLHKGHVEVRFEVEPGGTVADAAVVGTSSSRLNSAALDAVKQWRFQPTPAFHTAMVDLVFDADK